MKAKRLTVKGLSVWSSSTDVEIHSEDATREIVIYLNHTEDQTAKIIKAQNFEAMYPQEIQNLAGLIDLERVSVLQNAIRLLYENLEVLLPFMEAFTQYTTKSKSRVHRDN